MKERSLVSQMYDVPPNGIDYDESIDGVTLILDVLRAEMYHQSAVMRNQDIESRDGVPVRRRVKITLAMAVEMHPRAAEYLASTVAARRADHV